MTDARPRGKATPEGAGDAARLAELAGECAGEVWRLARRLAGNAAEDAVQEAFLGLLRARQAGMGRIGDFRAYFRLAVARRALWLQRRGRPALSLADLPEPAAPDGIPTHLAQQRELLAALGEELARLPAEWREPVVLQYLGGLSQAEIADSLGLTQQAVSLRVGKGREELRERLAGRGFALGLAALAGLLEAAGKAEAAAVPAGLAAKLAGLAEGAAAGDTAGAAGAAAATGAGVGAAAAGSGIGAAAAGAAAVGKCTTLFTVGGLAVTKTMVAWTAAAMFAALAAVVGITATQGAGEGKRPAATPVVAPAETAPAATAAASPAATPSAPAAETTSLPSPSAAADDAAARGIAGGLAWLARHQEPDGSWSCARFGGRREEYATAAVTGLALLAFLRAGEAGCARLENLPPVLGEALRRGLDWLAGLQQANGSFSPNNYAQAMCAEAAVRGYAATERGREAAQRAVECLARRQKPGGGWDYGNLGEPGRNRNDTSITGWVVGALAAAREAGLAVPEEAWQGALRHLNNAGAAAGDPARVSYAIMEGEVERGGAAILALILASQRKLGQPAEPFASRGVALLLDEASPAENFYRLYYQSQALAGRPEPAAQAWLQGLSQLLLQRQAQNGGDDGGSWNPAGDTYGADGGRVYATALGVLCLALCRDAR